MPLPPADFIELNTRTIKGLPLPRQIRQASVSRPRKLYKAYVPVVILSALRKPEWRHTSYGHITVTDFTSNQNSTFTSKRQLVSPNSYCLDGYQEIPSNQLFSISIAYNKWDHFQRTILHLIHEQRRHRYDLGLFDKCAIAEEGVFVQMTFLLKEYNDSIEGLYISHRPLDPSVIAKFYPDDTPVRRLALSYAHYADPLTLSRLDLSYFPLGVYRRAPPPRGYEPPENDPDADLPDLPDEYFGQNGLNSGLNSGPNSGHNSLVSSMVSNVNEGTGDPKRRRLGLDLAFNHVPTQTSQNQVEQSQWTQSTEDDQSQSTQNDQIYEKTQAERTQIQQAAHDHVPPNHLISQTSQVISQSSNQLISPTQLTQTGLTQIEPTQFGESFLTQLTDSLSSSLTLAQLLQTPFDASQSLKTYQVEAHVTGIFPSPDIFIKPFKRTMKVAAFSLVVSDSETSDAFDFYTEHDMVRFFSVHEIEELYDKMEPTKNRLHQLIGHDKLFRIQRKTIQLEAGFVKPYWTVVSTLDELILQP